MAVADLSPVSRDRLLPDAYRTHLQALPPCTFAQARTIPAWGDIFSEFCLLVRPSNPDEEAQFLTRVEEFLCLHCQQATTTQPNLAQRSDILAGQQHYCAQQQNDKTRRVLEKAFGAAWADRYMTTVLFDVPSANG
jgi:phycocyanobilin:ferredoxin oxidoreductase